MKRNHLRLVTNDDITSTNNEGESPMTGTPAPAVPVPPPLAPAVTPTGEMSEADYIRRKRNEEKIRLSNNQSTTRNYRLKPGDSKPRHR